jgi:hypothetical protein
MRLQLGWEVLNVSDGTEGWASSGRPVVAGPDPGQR